MQHYKIDYVINGSRSRFGQDAIASVGQFNEPAQPETTTAGCETQWVSNENYLHKLMSDFRTSFNSLAGGTKQPIQLIFSLIFFNHQFIYFFNFLFSLVSNLQKVQSIFYFFVHLAPLCTVAFLHAAISALAHHCSYLPPALSLSASPYSLFESRAACLFVKTFFCVCLRLRLGLRLCTAASAPPGRHMFIINSSCKLQNVYSGATLCHTAAIANMQFISMFICYQITRRASCCRKF